MRASVCRQAVASPAAVRQPRQQRCVPRLAGWRAAPPTPACWPADRPDRPHRPLSLLPCHCSACQAAQQAPKALLAAPPTASARRRRLLFGGELPELAASTSAGSRRWAGQVVGGACTLARHAGCHPGSSSSPPGTQLPARWEAHVRVAKLPHRRTRTTRVLAAAQPQQQQAAPAAAPTSAPAGGSARSGGAAPAAHSAAAAADAAKFEERGQRLEALIQLRKLYRNLLRAEVLVEQPSPVYQAAEAAPSTQDDAAAAAAAEADALRRLEEAVEVVAEMELTAEQIKAGLRSLKACPYDFRLLYRPEQQAAGAEELQARVNSLFKVRQGCGLCVSVCVCVT